MPLEEAISLPAAVDAEDYRDDYLQAFRHMIMARTLEDKLASLYRAGGRIVGGVYVGRGQEAFSAAAGIHIKLGRDVYAPLIRDQAGRCAYGEPLLDGIRTYLGTINGPMRGRDGNVHRGRPKEGLVAMISHLGSTISVVCGMLFARRMQGRLGDSAGAASIGDGGTSTGAFHEAINLASVEKLPLVISLANNQYAYSTPNDRQYACENLVDRAKGYGIDGHTVDGTDLLACLKVFRDAFKRARSGRGPQLVVGSLLRLSGHGEHDDSSYIPEAKKQSELGRDCLDLAEQFALSQQWATPEQIAEWRAECSKEVDQGVALVSKESLPDPFKTSWHALSTPELVEVQVG